MALLLQQSLINVQQKPELNPAGGIEIDVSIFFQNKVIVGVAGRNEERFELRRLADAVALDGLCSLRYWYWLASYLLRLIKT